MLKISLKLNVLRSFANMQIKLHTRKNNSVMA